MKVPPAEIRKPIIRIYLDSKTDDNLAPSIENTRMIIDAGKRVKPVSNAFDLVTCCMKTGMIKRKPAKGIC